jgi:hypothetical protein
VTWTLASAEARASSLASFEIPPRVERERLQVNDLVKLVFMNTRGEGERMWVKIETVGAGRYCGRLQNTPIRISSLQIDALVTFGPEHVADYTREGADA